MQAAVDKTKKALKKIIADITWLAKKIFVRKKVKVEDSDIVNITTELGKQGHKAFRHAFKHNEACVTPLKKCQQLSM